MSPASACARAAASSSSCFCRFSCCRRLRLDFMRTSPRASVSWCSSRRRMRRLSIASESSSSFSMASRSPTRSAKRSSASAVSSSSMWASGHVAMVVSRRLTSAPKSSWTSGKSRVVYCTAGGAGRSRMRVSPSLASPRVTSVSQSRNTTMYSSRSAFSASRRRSTSELRSVATSGTSLSGKWLSRTFSAIRGSSRCCVTSSIFSLNSASMRMPTTAPMEPSTSIASRMTTLRRRLRPWADCPRAWDSRRRTSRLFGE